MRCHACREDVRAHNVTALAWHLAKGKLDSAIYPVQMQHDAGNMATNNNVRQWLEDDGFHDLTHVAVGARVMYLSTVNKARGETNSRFGTVVGITLADQAPEGMQVPAGQRWVESITVRLDGEAGRTVTVRRSTMRITHRHGRAFSKTTFPLILGV